MKDSILLSQVTSLKRARKEKERRKRSDTYTYSK
jgi:hypothetical protein